MLSAGLRQVLFGSATPYRGAMLALDFAGSSRTGRRPYYMLNGRKYARISDVPGWTYTGGTAAGVGSYAAKADGSLQFFPSYTNTRTWTRAVENAAWVKRGTGSATASAIPSSDGTIAGSLLAGIGTAGVNDVYQLTQITLPPSSSYAPSLWINRVSTSGVIALKNAEDATKGEWRIDLATLGSGWQYITRSHSAVTVVSEFSTTAAGLNGLHFTAFSGSPLSFYVDKIQTELGSTASTYIPTTTAAVTVGTPRITDAGYWAEEARTNLLLRSQEFDNVGAWPLQAATVSANVTAAPDGTLTADKIVEAATTASHGVSQTVTKAASAITYTASAYFKADTRTRAVIWLNGSTSGNRVEASFNLSTGAVIIVQAIGTFTSASATITPASNGYFFATLTGTTNTDTSVQMRVFALDNTASASSPSYTGDGTSGIYIWQADLQAGSFATSPIPTTSVAVTRAADVGYLPLTGPTDGTILVQGSTYQLTGSPLLLGHSSADTSGIYASNAAGGIYNHWNGTANIGNTGVAVVTPSYKSVAIAYTGTSSRSMSAGGSAVTTSATTIGTVNRIAVGTPATLTNTAQSAQGPIRRIVIYPRAFANSELQAITLPTAA